MQTNSLYDRIIFDHSKWVLLVCTLLLIGLAQFADDFRLDASSDSLVLENDESLKYFREVVAKYDSSELLIVTYSPNEDLFSDAVLQDIKLLRERLLEVEGTKSMISILDVPLIQSPPVTLAELNGSPQTLLDEKTDRALARQELRNGPLYRDLLVSDDYSTTALVLSLQSDIEVQTLHARREALREQRAQGTLSPELSAELESVTLEHQGKAAIAQERQAALIQKVRNTIDLHRDNATLFLGGLPMIVADSISFIQADVVVFGGAALLMIVLILAIAFRQIGWVVMPLISCAATGFITVCLLGLLNWPISVVSSNFLSLLLIITLSLNIHLIVRYRELAKLNPEFDQRQLLSETVRSKFIPCVYTSLTTIVAFASLIVSGIRPVIDFGWIMCLGIAVSLLTTFTLFPALSLLMKPKRVAANRDMLSKLVLHGAQRAYSTRSVMTALFVLIFAAAAYGMANLTVENRFIDYFKPETEIYQGMVQIDSKLGGTTPMDIILDAPASFFAEKEAAEKAKAAEQLEPPASTTDAEEDDFFDEFEEDLASDSLDTESSEDDDFFDEFDDFDSAADDQSATSSQKRGGNIAVSSYWFNVDGIRKIKEIQADLEAMPATGKVLSLATSMSMFDLLEGAVEMDNIDLGFMYNVLSDDTKATLLDSYMSKDGNQLHINIRVFESSKGLDRNQLVADVRQMLIDDHGIADEQINISGMLVLYNNMLNSLFSSQILTLGTVFIVIFLMFIVLFRSIKMALITIIPNVFSAGVVLGIMGIFSIPLDLMTITIAAISVGIAVDNSIHFVHRFRDNFAENHDYSESIDSAKNNVGQAMLYTTLVITAGFLIMVFSNFVPTLYFGVLTAIAMVTALFANLVMLPMLIASIKPQN